jgi:hypothetical protein
MIIGILPTISITAKSTIKAVKISLISKFINETLVKAKVRNFFIIEQKTTLIIY